MSLRQITIIGTGLIGGSLALALRRKKFAGKIIGCDREAILEKAHNCGAIDEGTVEPGDAVRGSDVVVLATPVLAIVDLIQRLGPALPRHDFADRCRKHEASGGRAREESLRQERGELLFGWDIRWRERK